MSASALGRPYCVRGASVGPEGADRALSPILRLAARWPVPRRTPRRSGGGGGGAGLQEIGKGLLAEDVRKCGPVLVQVPDGVDAKGTQRFLRDLADPCGGAGVEAQRGGEGREPPQPRPAGGGISAGLDGAGDGVQEVRWVCLTGAGGFGTRSSRD